MLPAPICHQPTGDVIPKPFPILSAVAGGEQISFSLKISRQQIVAYVSVRISGVVHSLLFRQVNLNKHKMPQASPIRQNVRLEPT
jgi:hypothetical protein